MSDKSQRLSKVAKEFNVGVDTILEFLASKGIDDLNRNSKISSDTYEVLVQEYQPDKKVKAEAKELKKAEIEQKVQLQEEIETLRVSAPKIEGLKIVSKILVGQTNSTEKVEQKEETNLTSKAEEKKQADQEENVVDEKNVIDKTDEVSCF